MGEMNENTQKVQIEKRERDRERKQILSKYASKLYKRSLNQRTSDMCKCKQHGCFINKWREEREEKNSAPESCYAT